MSDYGRAEIGTRLCSGDFDVITSGGYTWLDGSIFGMRICAPSEVELQNGLRGLGRAIDPTCHAVPIKQGSQIMVCDTCGNIIDDWVAKYCASCGSRIVSYVDEIRTFQQKEIG